MKGNKKLLAVALLLLLVTVTFGTYAIYRQSVSGNGTIKAAAWNVTVKGSAIESANLDFGIGDITWTTHRGKNNTIAPGDTGTITIPVVATGSEVDVELSAAITSTAGLPAGFTAEVTSGTSGVQTIPYGDTMTANVVITVTWVGTEEDLAGKDQTDLDAAGSTLTIPVTLTAQQSLD